MAIDNNRVLDAAFRLTDKTGAPVTGSHLLPVWLGWRTPSVSRMLIAYMKSVKISTRQPGIRSVSAVKTPRQVKARTKCGYLCLPSEALCGLLWESAEIRGEAGRLSKIKDIEHILSVPRS